MSTVSRYVFRLGLRLAVLSASALFLISAPLYYVFSNDVGVSLLFGISIGLISFIAVYFCSYYLMFSRLSGIQKVVAATPRTSISFSDSKSSGSNDELDRILELSKESKKLVRDHFRNMDETDHYRKEFIGDISHELKTPIFSVQGYLETLSQGALDDPKVNKLFLTKAMNNVDRLISLTNDLMEITKIETGELKPELQIIALNNIINDVIDSLNYKAEQAQITIRFQPKEVNSFAFADRNQIRQVLINLVENAIKYNKPEGRIYIGTTIEKSDPEHVLVSVKDTGIGIEPENLKRVTERFYRVDKSRSRDQGGTGLGLAIVKHILESHNSQLQIKSKPGSGSQFSFKLKLADHYSDHISA
ncbi:sensor histidine kinase [Natronogracilivirga saccharolytica]|uniref:histidine kinase n=1 Tax=Natronogracilivirga saccharolytica TaxID=2812953 RepID=A0A8J7UVV5_9BACT|nr:ATP-binding protein [Natronogracilivirga saccharolytica]MBP3191559.1 GHKL domain-containing protein [Natronogracilivirga saccharolytica]